jgi:hypothetical protein
MKVIIYVEWLGSGNNKSLYLTVEDNEKMTDEFISSLFPQSQLFDCCILGACPCPIVSNSSQIGEQH